MNHGNHPGNHDSFPVSSADDKLRERETIENNMADKIAEIEAKTGFKIPSWAGKPPQGLHLDVMKNGNLVEKMIIDEKPCYLFGRNKDLCDFHLEHTSCSRFHSVLIYHKHLKRSFLVDLKSTHGTFIGSIQLDPNKPTQVQVDSIIRFGASSRSYTMREKPTQPGSALKSAMSAPNTGEDVDMEEGSKGGLLGLPESDSELDDLTEFNTAHNKRIQSIGIEEPSPNIVPSLKRRRTSSASVHFREGEEIINPEDIDPSVGRFRNMVSTTVVIPAKKMRGVTSPVGSMTENITRRMQSFPYSQGLYSNLPAAAQEPTSPTSPTSPTAATKTKLNITSAPAVASPAVNNFNDIHEPVAHAHPAAEFVPVMAAAEAPKKKKYAKEAWPGKKPTPALLI